MSGLSSSKRRALDRQRFREHVAAVLQPVPIPYALEVIAARLDLRDGWLEVRLRDGFVQHATRVRVHDPHDLGLPRGWSDDGTRAVTNSLMRAARAFERSVELKFDDGELRSLVTIDEYTAAELAKDRPVPSPSQRTRKRRVEL